jgi:prepilin-type N-terminal cleavage/methylation domain-containing protein
MKRAFTLIEMLIAVGLLSVITLFLYQTYSSLQHSNRFYGEELSEAAREQKLRKTIYLDLALSMPDSIKLINIDKNSDVLIMQSSHSVHQRIMPYIAYLVKDAHLMRIESSQKLSYPLSGEEEMVIDDLEEVNIFRVFQKDDSFLVHLEEADKKMILFRTNRLNDVVDF